MTKLYLKPLLLLMFFMAGLGMNGQNSLWQKVSLAETDSQNLQLRNSNPTDFDVFKLNTQQLKTTLASAPQRFSGISSVIIDLPVGDGITESFRVYEASNFAPGLQAKYPGIRSYAAQGIDSPAATARFSVSDYGLNVIIHNADKEAFYIDSYTQDGNYYLAYNRSNLPEYNDGFHCYVENVENEIGAKGNPEAPENANDGKLRTFRLALACTGEYSTFHLNRRNVPNTATDEEKKAAIMAEMNDAITRVNSIYERDVAISLEIIDNNDELIFFNAQTDPYTNNNGMIMLNENQNTVDTIIGAANYDIGHVFSTGGGGIAQLRSPCVNGSKARGVTGLPQPINDPFYIDYVCHEMGHQFGANHTFNNSCQGNINPGTAMEPGSGSTIMSYAGICPPNVASSGSAYFHAMSIAEMWSNITIGSSTCGAQSDTNNAPPVADAGANYTIPKSTPFVLEGSATDANDPDGEALTYSWEQMNPQQGPMPPRSTNNLGPLFRSLDPSTEPHRYFPKIQTILNGQTSNNWEVVPSVARTMNFRFTVRDNNPGGGASDHKNMRVTVNGDAGPFLVTSQDAISTWVTRTTETITWDVAGTDAAPINATNVDIFFSTDGGLTYPVTIAAGVPNTGSATINVPNLNTNRGRFMVRGAGNIFFSVNKANITVTGEVGVEDFAFDNFAVYPNPSNGTFNLRFTPETSDNIEVSLYDIRGRLIDQKVFNDRHQSIFHEQLDYNTIGEGIYFLKVKNGSKQVTKKVIKK